MIDVLNWVSANPWLTVGLLAEILVGLALIADSIHK